MLKTLYKSGLFRKIALAIFTFILVIVVSYVFWQPANERLNLSLKGKNWFSHRPLLTEIFRLFDLGVVDVNSDNILDIFTSNHNHGQLLLLGDGQGNFSDNVTSQWGLDQDRDFPGLEFSGVEPSIDAPGLYIYWQDRNLVIKNHNTENTDPIKGVIKFSAPMTIEQSDRYKVDVKNEELSTGAIISEVRFASQSKDGTFIFNPHNVSLPISFQLDEKLPLEQIYIGNQKLNPDSHEFSFYLRDRHGMAWADYNDRGMLDVFIARGGLKARMNKVPERFSDELLVNDDKETKTFKESIDGSGIVKDGCPALQTAWVDVDNDDLLDIYTVCFNPKDESQGYPNQLYRQNSEGKFVNVAAEMNLDISERGSFVWLDADRDGDIDLFWATDEAFWLYVNQSGKFEPELIGTNPGSVAQTFEDSNKLTIADYDADGDLDLFAASPQGNALLVNDEGTYKVVEPKQVGLPAQALTANWIDYDNDGLMDLHFMPGGLYHQHQDHTFEDTHLLESKSKELIEARATWLDADNNGSRDLLLATRYSNSLSNRIYNKITPQSLQPTFWALTLYPNIGNINHWLEVKLVGPSGNRPAIGTNVEIVTSDGVQLQAVGQSDGSQYSQGHYRLYFGLGQQEKVDSIKVFWSDGYVQEFKNIPSDQLLTLIRME